jgi:ABC-2 type transport system permease protein
MRTLRFLLEKEFRQIFRDPVLLRIIIIMPIVQLLIFPLAADYEIKNINIAIVDHDRSVYSRELSDKIMSSGYFVLADYSGSYKDGFENIESGAADLVLEIPENFERNLRRGNNEKLFLALNAINGTKASVGGAYMGQIIAGFNRDIRLQMASGPVSDIKQIEVSSINWFNPHLNYQWFMVPGILAILVTMIGSYICSLNIVKEKEVGTIEQINVTPIRKHHFILGKLIPFWIIGMVIFTICLFGIARLVYQLEPLGSIPVLYAYVALFLVAILGIGLLISTYSHTQQQAMFVAFFVMMIFLLLSGLFTPVESMPFWARGIAAMSPVTYLMEVMRMIILKGSGFKELQMHFLITAGFALFFNGWAILNYRKTN